MAGTDFVFVKLTPKGEEQAQGHPLRVSGRVSVQFTPGLATRVARYEWDLMLKNYETSHGEPLFELVPEPPCAVLIPELPEAPEMQHTQQAETTNETPQEAK